MLQCNRNNVIVLLHKQKLSIFLVSTACVRTRVSPKIQFRNIVDPFRLSLARSLHALRRVCPRTRTARFGSEDKYYYNEGGAHTLSNFYGHDEAYFGARVKASVENKNYIPSLMSQSIMISFMQHNHQTYDLHIVYFVKYIY